MGKIGFRIRSTATGSVPVYVYVYLSSTKRQEVKTGLLVQASFWNSELQRSVDASLAAGELNQQLDRLEQFILKEINRTAIKGSRVDKHWLESHVNACFYRVTLTKKNLLLYQIEQYIECAPTKRVRRTGSIGLSPNTIRNLMRFYELVESFGRIIRITRTRYICFRNI